MATLIPTLSTCLPRMMAGEKRVAMILESQLEDDYYCWYDVPIGGKSLHPDFIILHPYRGLLVLEVKDWKASTLLSINKDKATILDNDSGKAKEVINPINQARNYILSLINMLSKDSELNLRLQDAKTKPLLSYGYGVVLSNITRAEFNQGQLGNVIPEQCVICKDELSGAAALEMFQERLWGMFPYVPIQPLTLPQIDRVRWHIFPELRIGEQRDMFDPAETKVELPDILKIMDIQQEQLARSLGDGHRIIHGVAGSGKTMILGYRAEHLARFMQKPILVLCFNRPLADTLKNKMVLNKLNHKVHVRTFHQWCDQQLNAYNIPRSRNIDRNQMFAENVQKVIDHAETGIIPKGQYDAILIDEGHDFEDEWYKLIVQMVNPNNPCLLVLYDDAQSIYSKNKRKLVFSKVGIRAVGRTVILKLNYRNTKEILTVAKQFADQLLVERKENDEDSVPLLEPVGADLNGDVPVLIKLPSMYHEVRKIIETLCEHQHNGLDWQQMVVLCRNNKSISVIKEALQDNGIPIYGEEIDGIGVHVMTMHRSKGLEFPLVCIFEVGNRNVCYEDIDKEAQLLYVAMTRATRNLVMTCHSSSHFAPQLTDAISAVNHTIMINH